MIPLSAIFQLDEIEARAMRYLRPVDKLGIGALEERSFHEVKELQRMFNQLDNFEAAFLLIIKMAGVKNPGIVDFFHTFNYLLDSMGKINNMESNSLSYVPTEDEEAANIERFARYGYLMQVDSLAGGDILKYEEVKSIPYKIAFAKLVLDKDRADFDKELMKVQQRKINNNG